MGKFLHPILNVRRVKILRSPVKRVDAGDDFSGESRSRSNPTEEGGGKEVLDDSVPGKKKKHHREVLRMTSTITSSKKRLLI